MPDLRSLHISLFEEDQVDYLLRNLGDLMYLNGLSVEREALFNEDEELIKYEGKTYAFSNQHGKLTYETVTVNTSKRYPSCLQDANRQWRALCSTIALQ